jgi:hypothetical protein
VSEEGGEKIRPEPPAGAAGIVEIAAALDDPPFLVARRDDVLRFAHRTAPGASDLSFEPAAEPGEFVILYRAHGSDGEPVEMARGPEAPIRDAFERFSGTWFEPPSLPGRLLRLGFYVSTALNLALLLKLLFF